MLILYIFLRRDALGGYNPAISKWVFLLLWVMAFGAKLLHLLYIFLFNTFKEGLHLSSLTKLYLDEEEDSAQEAKQLSIILQG